MRSIFICLIVGTATIMLSACNSGYNFAYDVPAVDGTKIPKCGNEVSAVTASATTQTEKTLDLIADLSCGTTTGVLPGQNSGFGNEVDDDNNERSYNRLITPITNTTNNTPALLAIEYEYSRIYNSLDLEVANTRLNSHRLDGGIVSISWMPLNPWINDGSDRFNNTGSSADTTHTDADDQVVDLQTLIDENSTYGSIWLARLDTMADALLHLQGLGTTVLWRPLPDMNSDTFWWGNLAAADGSTTHADYIALWKHMKEHFETRGVTNTLWVYSPISSKHESSQQSAIWAYPGADYVDIVAPIERNNNLTISDYTVLSDLQHPMGVAEYGPLPAEDGGSFSKDRTFDNTRYSTKLLTDYPHIAYWVSWHNYVAEGQNDYSYQALTDQTQLTELMTNDDVLSIERLQENNLTVDN